MKVLAILATLSLASCEKPLEGRNLNIVLWDFGGGVVRNVSGHLERATDYFEIFKWLSLKLGFTFTVLPHTGPLFMNTSKEIGLSTYLLNGEADMFVGAVVVTESLRAIMDFPFPWTMTSYDAMIPVPKISSNFGAPWMIFHWSVWISIGVASIAVVMSLFFFNWASKTDRLYFTMNRSLDYTFFVLLLQGAWCHPRKSSIRFVAAAWCIAAFFLVNFYCSVLISAITKPIQVALFNSVYDLPNKPDVYVAIEKGLGFDRIVTSAESGILKYLNETLKKEPSIRCQVLDQCLDKVVQGTHIFIQVTGILNSYINKQIVPRYGKCQATLAKNGFMTMYGAMALPKHSPYTNHINEGTIRLWETGLIYKWTNEYFPAADKCIASQSQRTRITLNNLQSSFIIFITGSLISIAVFVIETILRFHKAHGLQSIRQKPREY